MTSTPDLSIIASKLSEAQRRAIMRAQETLFGGRWILTLRDRWSTKVVMNLRKKGICEPEDIARDRLTPLGTQLLSYLKEQAR